jgi:hypothetical protein
MDANPRATWRNPRILLTLFLIFTCGSLAGALIMRYGVEPKVQTPAVYWTKGGKQLTMDRYQRELNLSPEQAVQMEMILDDFVAYYHTLQSQMDEVRANGKRRIQLILNPEQQRQFEEMLKEVPLREMH